MGSVEIGKANCNSWIHLFDLNPTVAHDQAASMIQSLATGTDVLDLSAFNAHPSANTLNPAAFDANFVATLNIPGTSFINAATANTNAESYLQDLSSDPILAAISNDGVQTITMTGLSTNDQEECWETAQLKMELAPLANSYKLNISQYKAFDGAVEPEAGQCNDVPYYDCAENPFSKVITGRNIAASRFSKVDHSFTQGQVIGCYNPETEEMVDFDTGCPQDFLEITTATAQDFKLDFGANLNVQISDSKVQFNFSETYDSLEAVQVGESTTVNFVKKKYTCRYASSISL